MNKIKQYLEIFLIVCAALGAIGGAASWILPKTELWQKAEASYNYMQQAQETILPEAIKREIEQNARIDALEAKHSGHYSVGKRFNIETGRLQYRDEHKDTYDLTVDEYYSTAQFTVYFYYDKQHQKHWVY